MLLIHVGENKGTSELFFWTWFYSVLFEVSATDIFISLILTHFALKELPETHQLFKFQSSFSSIWSDHWSRRENQYDGVKDWRGGKWSGLTSTVTQTETSCASDLPDQSDHASVHSVSAQRNKPDGPLSEQCWFLISVPPVKKSVACIIYKMLLKTSWHSACLHAQLRTISLDFCPCFSAQEPGGESIHPQKYVPLWYWWGRYAPFSWLGLYSGWLIHHKPNRFQTS